MLLALPTPLMDKDNTRKIFRSEIKSSIDAQILPRDFEIHQIAVAKNFFLESAIGNIRPKEKEMRPLVCK